MVTLIINDFGARAELTFYTKRRLERWVRDFGTASVVDVQGSFGPVRNVAARFDWLDAMASGVVEFDLDEVDALREQELREWNEWLFSDY